jgi:hypothetical protein
MVRAMSNNLRPIGIPMAAYKHGRAHSSTVPNASTSLMPAGIGSLIATPRGIRQSLDDKHARCLGTPSNWMPWSKAGNGNISLSVGFLDYVANTTALALWEASLWTTPHTTLELPPTTGPLQIANVPTRVTSWTWAPPDLSLDSPWNLRQIQSLHTALQRIGKQDAVHYNQGLFDLAAHQSNYDAYGATLTTLRILRWQFPPEHWTALREGSSMNVMVTPPSIPPVSRQWTALEQQVRVEFMGPYQWLFI